MNIDWTYRPSKMQSFAALVAHKPKLVAFTTSALIAGIGAVAIEFLLKAYSQQKRAIPFSITVGARAGWALTVLAGTALAYKLCRDQSSFYYSDFEAWGSKVGSSVQCFYKREDIVSILATTQTPDGKSFNWNKKNLQKILDCLECVIALRTTAPKIPTSIFDVKRLSTEDNKAFINGFEAAIKARTLGVKQLIDRLTVWGDPQEQLRAAIAEAEPVRLQSDIQPCRGSAKSMSFNKASKSVNEDLPFHQTWLDHELLVVVDGHTDAGAVGQLMKGRFFSLIDHYMQEDQHANKIINYPSVLERAFKALDAEYFEQFNQGKTQGGAVAVAVLIPPGKKMAYVATLGDCEAILLRRDKIECLSILGNWTNEGEKLRVQNHLAQDSVICEKGLSDDLKNGLEGDKNPSWPPRSIPGSCQASRSIGDFSVKYASSNMDAWIAQVPSHNSAPLSITTLPEKATPIILNTPSVQEYALEAGDIFILGSDGLFDNLTHEEIKGLARETKPASLPYVLVTKACEHKRKVDDITCLAYQVP